LSKHTPTGVSGLDELLSGGYPQGRVVLIIGGPGSGKTILASQFLHSGISDYKENGIYVSLDESKEHYFSEMLDLGWDFKKAEEERNFVFIEATKMSKMVMLRERLLAESKSLRGDQLQVDKLVEEIQNKRDVVNAQRIVIDSLATLFNRFPDPTERRIVVTDLIEALSEMKATTIVTTELGQLSLRRRSSVEEYTAHGVILMQTLFSRGSTSRALQVVKMRQTKINPNLVPYTIGDNGIQVYPQMSVFEEK
jgi:KaiC/GvpD/RAD55 family RecA-like ATPase